MPEIVTTPLAKEDLKGIWKHSFKKWGETQADKYIDEINTKIMQLKDNPKLGKSRENLRAGYRSLPVNKHIAYYITTSTRIQIIRILHQRTDPNQHTLKNIGNKKCQ